MKFRVLGCSGSESDRNHPCSFMIDRSLVVDMGSAASRLTLDEQFKVTDILLSHAHLDHTKDVAFFCENIFIKASTTVTLRGTADTLRKLKEHLLNNELWPDFTSIPSKNQSIIRYEPFKEGEPVRVGSIEVLPVPVNHPGGCVAMFFRSPTGTILYSGDTGPTDEMWKEANRRGSELKSILLETSFPNRLQSVADVSGHHTPQTLAKELKKLSSPAVPVYVYHLKAPYRAETVKELEALDDPRIRILEPGMTLDF